MIRILSFSDIHNNISAVQSLRNQEENNYDAIIVAGDIGNYIWPEILAVMDTFECPVYFVYGNWDNRQPYTRELSRNCILLNQEIEFHNGYYFTGFSGCTTHWGMNPLFMEKINSINSIYRDEIEAHEKKQLDARAQLEYSIKTITNTYTRNRRKIKKASDGKYSVRSNREILELKKWKSTELEKITSQGLNIISSTDYINYKQAVLAAHSSTLSLNKDKLFKLIKNTKIPSNHLIIVTHERITKIPEEELPAAIHIFGHRHSHKLTKSGLFSYLNTAQLDSSINMAGCVAGGYCVIELDENSISVERRTLPFLFGSKIGSSYI